MGALGDLEALASSMRQELEDGILPYWQQHTVDHQHGGFYGQISSRGEVVANAPKGAVLNTRLLWTFSIASRMFDEDRYRPLADRAYAHLKNHFWDEVHGGVYWMLRYDGEPLETKKQVYAQAFAVYALSEYHRLTETPESLEWAIECFRLLEEHAFDEEEGGYLEAYSRDWHLLDNVRLSEKDANEKKSMNTHLHVLEAYTNLCRVWPNSALKRQLRGVLRIFLDTIVDDETNHLIAFFNEEWEPRSTFVSFGHDIEASWLLVKAAETLGEERLLEETQAAALRIARVVREEGMDEEGGLFYEAEAVGTLDDDKHCWPQAEAVVGFVNAYQLSRKQSFLEAATSCWSFTQEYIIDREGGEWFFRVSRRGTPYYSENKVGPWKGPYHGVRACLEVMARADSSLTAMDPSPERSDPSSEVS